MPQNSMTSFMDGPLAGVQHRSVWLGPGGGGATHTYLLLNYRLGFLRMTVPQFCLTAPCIFWGADDRSLKSAFLKTR